MGFGVSAPVERCKTSGLLRASETARPGTRPHKDDCLPHQNRVLRPPAYPKSASLVGGVLTLLNVVNRLSQSPREELRLSASYVNFIQLNRKVRMRGDCELGALATANAGTRTFDLRFPETS